MSTEKNSMPGHIKDLYIILLKRKLTAREYLERNLNSKIGSGKNAILIYNSTTAAWISGYVL